jgi:YVTN family beta-propeller protein
MLSVKEAPEVKIVTLPELNIINNNILAGNISVTLNNPITFIKEFGDNLYLSAQKDFKLIILKKTTFEEVAIIDFSAEEAEVGDFVFPNSTDCYLVHPNKNYLSIIDITVFKKVRTAAVGNKPASISANGNQLIVTNSIDNTISIVDMRTRNEAAKITTNPQPNFSFITKDGIYAGVISIGLGKVDAAETKSPAILSFYDVLNRKESEILEIGEGLISAVDIQPVGVAITNSEWIYIATTTALFRADARSRKDMKFLIKKNFTGIINDEPNAQLILSSESTDKNEIFMASNKTGTIQKAIRTPFKIQSMMIWR